MARDFVSLDQWREEMSRTWIGLDFKPVEGAPVRLSTSLVLPGAEVSVAHFESQPGYVLREQSVLSRDRIDSYALLIAGRTPLEVVNGGRPIRLAPGEATVVQNNRCGWSGYHRAFSIKAAMLPAAALSRGGIEGEEIVSRGWRRSSPALSLLREYMTALERLSAATNAQLRDAAERHVADLIVIGAQEVLGRPADQLPASVHAARLGVALGCIAAHYADPELSVARVAAAQGISARYLHRLLEREGLRFSEHVNALRLDRAHRDLTDPAQAGRSITEIALAAGFGDVSHFNRLFRRRFDATPTAVRDRGRTETDRDDGGR